MRFRERAALTFRAAASVRISTDATMLLTDRVDQLDVHPDAMRVRKHVRVAENGVWCTIS